MILVEIQKYVDFDMPATILIMAAPEGMGKKALVERLAVLENAYSDCDEVDGLVKELKAEGFTVCKSVTVAVGGGL